MYEDNQAMIQVVKTDRNPTMRYLDRTHRVSVGWLHEVCTSDDVCLEYTQSTDMAADIYTKAYTNAMKWKAVCLLINLVKLDELPELFARWCSLLSTYYPIAPAGNANGDCGTTRLR